ncbi:hypothetical protein PSOL_02230 [Candidatus Phytoplasma solani]
MFSNPENAQKLTNLKINKTYDKINPKVISILNSCAITIH